MMLAAGTGSKPEISPMYRQQPRLGVPDRLITGPETHQRHPPPYLWAPSKLPAKETLLQTSTLSACFVIENSCSGRWRWEEWKNGESTIHNFSGCAELKVAIMGQVGTRNSRAPVGMMLPSSKETDRKSKLLSLNHRWLLILNSGFRIGSELCLIAF